MKISEKFLSHYGSLIRWNIRGCLYIIRICDSCIH